MPVTKTEVLPYIFYRDVPAALEWLTRAFGFKEEKRTTPPVAHRKTDLRWSWSCFGVDLSLSVGSPFAGRDSLAEWAQCADCSYSSVASVRWGSSRMEAGTMRHSARILGELDD